MGTTRGMYIEARFSYVTVDVPELFLKHKYDVYMMTRTGNPGAIMMLTEEHLREVCEVNRMNRILKPYYCEPNHVANVQISDEIQIPYFMYEHIKCYPDDRVLLAIARGENEEELGFLLTVSEGNMINAKRWMETFFSRKGKVTFEQHVLPILKIGIAIPDELGGLKEFRSEIRYDENENRLLICAKDLMKEEKGDEYLEMKIEDLYLVNRKVGWGFVQIRVENEELYIEEFE